MTNSGSDYTIDSDEIKLNEISININDTSLKNNINIKKFNILKFSKSKFDINTIYTPELDPNLEQYNQNNYYNQYYQYTYCDNFKCGTIIFIFIISIFFIIINNNK